jgi:hypothetical protein
LWRRRLGSWRGASGTRPFIGGPLGFGEGRGFLWAAVILDVRAAGTRGAHPQHSIVAELGRFEMGVRGTVRTVKATGSPALAMGHADAGARASKAEWFGFRAPAVTVRKQQGGTEKAARKTTQLRWKKQRREDRFSVFPSSAAVKRGHGSGGRTGPCKRDGSALLRRTRDETRMRGSAFLRG